jgi:hypothetical protein
MFLDEIGKIRLQMRAKGNSRLCWLNKTIKKYNDWQQLKLSNGSKCPLKVFFGGWLTVRTVLLLEVMHTVGGIQEKENWVVIIDKTLHFKLPITTTEDLFRAIDYFYYNHTVTISVRYPTSTLHQGTSLLQPNAQVTHPHGILPTSNWAI